VQKRIARIPLTLKVNGEEHQLLVRPQQTLIGVLRDDLGLTGTKQGCDDGTCGTCVVTVNGAMARACRVPIDRVQGKDVLTIEGLGTPERLHPLQEAFIKAGAVQCGFCTPGAIMAAKALLDRNPAPTRAQTAKALGIIHKIIEVPEVGKTYTGKVKKITDFGAFVEILPGTDGLLHISQIAEQRIVRVEDVLKEGDEVTVKVIEIDRAGKVRLSRKEVLRDQQQHEKR